MWSSLPCFCTFCCFAIPTSCYILNVFYYLFTSFFSSLSTCLSWGLPSHSNRSLSQAATDIWTIDSGISYTGSIGWRITDPSVLSNTKSCFLNAWIYGYPQSWDRESWLFHPSREGLDKTSLNHSDIFILMIGTYRSLFKYLVRLTTQRILGFSTAYASRPGTLHSKIIRCTPTYFLIQRSWVTISCRC